MLIQLRSLSGVVDNLLRELLLDHQVVFCSLFVLTDMNTFVDDASSGHEIMVTEFGDDILLLNHLNFLDNDLEIDEW